ncbi:unnamed protein product [Diabrotica balteata]|uniref:Uncharacterized protein n=1 Tax=Diabrotica balteata TaxID=107213 RepID=A0A9N9TA98_DIABA|nr:unnamed protein product [Diabrotica balteata]
MNIEQVILFLVILGTITAENVKIETILSKILSIHFKKCVYYIFDESPKLTNLPKIINSALMISYIPMITIQQNNSKQLLESKCHEYLIYTENMENFEKLANIKELLEMFRPWGKMIFITSTKPNVSSNFLTVAVNEKAIDYAIVTIVENNVTVELTFGDSFNFTNIPQSRKRKWIPKFASPIRITIFHCPPYVIIGKNNSIYGVEMTILRESFKGLPVQYLVHNNESEDGGMWFNTLVELEVGQRELCICSRWPENGYKKNLEIMFLVRTEQFSNYLRSRRHRPVYYYVQILLDLMRIFTGGGVCLRFMYRLLSSKTVLICWLYTCLVFGTYYSAGITSTLAFPPIMNVVNTLQDMVRLHVPWKLSNDYYKQEFQLRNSTLYNGLANLHVLGNRIEDRTPNSAIMAKVIENHFVSDLEALPERDRKYYKVVKPCVATHESVFFVKKDSALTKLLDQTITKFVESGIFRYLILKKLNKFYGTAAHESFFSNYVENRFYTNIGMSKIIDNNKFDGTEKVILEETLHDQVNYSVYSYDTTDGSMWFNTIPEVEAGTKDICGCSRWPLNAYNKNLELTKSTHQICVTFLHPLNDVARYFLDLVHIFTGAGINLRLVYNLYSSKFLLTVWFFTCLVCGTFYAAAVTSTTARPPITNVVNNLQDMVRLKIPWKLTNTVPKKEFLLINSTLYTKLANLHVYGRRIEDRSQNSAIFVTLVENQYVVDIVTLPEEAKQYYKVIKQCVATHGSVFFVKKDTPLTKLIDKTITRFVESGIANYILFKYLHLYDSGSQATFFTNYVANRFYRTIGMSKLVGAFILLDPQLTHDPLATLDTVILAVGKCHKETMAPIVACYID